MAMLCNLCFFFQAEDGIRDLLVTGVQTCALPICLRETGLILRCDRKVGNPFQTKRGVDPPVQIRRVEEAQRKGCRKTSVFLSRETGMSGHFVGRIKGDKYRFELQFLKWDFS